MSRFEISPAYKQFSVNIKITAYFIDCQLIYIYIYIYIYIVPILQEAGYPYKDIFVYGYPNIINKYTIIIPTKCTRFCY
jgi:hypothetical protein